MQVCMPWKFLLTVVALVGLPRPSHGAYTDAKKLKFTGNFNPFKVLELPTSKSLPDADKLKKAFKAQALKWHPDRCSRTKPIEECESKMENVKLAQEVLSDHRKLQQWEAWREDKITGGPKPEDEGRRGGFGGSGGGGGFGGFGANGFPGGFPGGFDGGRPKPAPRPRPSPPPPKAKPKPKKEEPKDWRIVSTEPGTGMHGARVEVITRERDLPGTPMIQVEIVERSCYAAQVECKEQVIERKRRRKDAPSGGDEL